MRDTFLRLLTDNERNRLHEIMLGDKESGYRAKIILFKDAGYTIPEIRREQPTITISTSENGYIDSMKSIEGIISKIHIHKPVWITDDIEREKDCRDINQKSKKRVRITILNMMVITYTC